ncbi:MAG: 2OG-Fe(II) oxygenase [Deltaproteobacteria bacterium]|nr:2OG-Fe(II) oxygenase [Deltaproteobacteria bacterium]MBI3295176.1 2OG-Fe(II) oxygenase [Deltaproteobacteria bacterium]
MSKTVFDYQKLESFAATLSESYASARPFPHIVVDEFGERDRLAEALAVVPRPGDDIGWEEFDTPTEKKLAQNRIDRLPIAIVRVLEEMNAPPFLAFLERLTGITGLIADPDLIGGGLHQIVPGGFLGIHADFNYHPKWRWDRRLNVLLFLNEGWQEEFGGHLELWDEKLSASKRVLPVFNRMVCFSTTDVSFHGHPEPLCCPSERTRKSLALYYYTKGRPRGERSFPHSTLFQALPKGGGRGIISEP